MDHLPNHQGRREGEAKEVGDARDGLGRKRSPSVVTRRREEDIEGKKNNIEPIRYAKSQSSSHDLELEMKNKKPTNGNMQRECGKRAIEQRKDQTLSEEIAHKRLKNCIGKQIWNEKN